MDELDGSLRPGGGCCILNSGALRESCVDSKGVRSAWPDAVGEGTASNGLRSVRAFGVSCSEGVDGQNLSMAEEEMECGATTFFNL